MDTLKGFVEKIIFHNPENGYAVLSIEDNELSTVCVGHFSQIEAGTFMEFSGEFVFHPKLDRKSVV